ncbi:MAG: DUF2334 domain-containing protein [Chloroflexota bacterium]|nr:DUF2334 domain-containing protein [Chloroflexota bacterium]
MRDGRVVVSVYDVSSSTLEDSRWIIERLDRLGARPLVVHVIPSPPSAALADLVRAERQRGSQIALHGVTHRAEGAARGPVLVRARAALFAGGGAEMLTVDPSRLADHLRRGRALLAELGADSDAFCAPGWLSPPGVAAALRAAGLRYQVGMWTVTDVVAERVVWTMPLGYMGVGGVHEGIVTAISGFTLAVRRHVPVVAAFLHPQGASSSRAAARTLDAIRRLLTERRPATYAEVA